MSATVALIAAAARNGAIGRDKDLPWRLPQDLRHFKSMTLGKPVIMGRRTYESIGKPLPGRDNIVVSRHADWPAPPGVMLANSLSGALEIAQEALEARGEPDGEIMVMGGGEIYRNSLPLASRIYLTRVELDVEGDTYFPELPNIEWRLVSEVTGDKDAPIAHSFRVYERLGDPGQNKRAPI